LKAQSDTSFCARSSQQTATVGDGQIRRRIQTHMEG
jgi:hypothetical protein